jgi:serine/threonine-protein kinase
VAYPSGGDVWVENVERGTRARLTSSRGVNDDEPLWTPDGSRVTFGSVQAGSSWDLVWKPADGSGEAEVLLRREHPQLPSSWSPDGRLLAFYEVHPTTQRDIWLLPLDDRTPSSLLVTDANEHSAMFSPDGRFVAYVSDESGREEVYVRSYAGPPGRWLISSEGGREPVWSRDGRELFYRHGSRLMTVAVTLEPTLTAGQPQELFAGSYALYIGGGNSYDATPDGQRFVMVQGGSASTSYPLRIVVNWLEELEEKMREAGRTTDRSSR